MSITLVDVYTRKLEDFNAYVLGKRYTTDVNQRRELLFDTGRLFENILKADQAIVNKVLRHFIDIIIDNVERYDPEKIFRPIGTIKIKDLPKDVDIRRTISFVKFFIKLAENAHHVDRYLSGCDLPYFFKDWEIPQREVLLNFFCDIRT